MSWQKIVSCLLILFFVGLLITPHSLDPTSPVESTTRGDAAHFPAFLLLTLLFYFIFFQDRSFAFRIISGTTIATILAISSELLQSFIPGRTAALNDMFANLLGIGAALTGFWIWNQSRSPLLSRKKLLHALVTIGIATALAWPYLQHVNARLAGQKQFPTLSDFHHPRFALLWKTQKGAKAKLSELTDHATPALEVTFPGKQNFEGINYRPGSQDWSDFNSLQILLINPGTPFTLGIRIDDDGDISQLNARFNAGPILKPGENQLSFPLETIRQAPENRELNLEAIRRIALFTLKDSGRRKFQIVRVWLEK